MIVDEGTWAHYAASLRELDRIRQDAIAAVIARRDAAGAAQAQIAMARQRAALQRSRFIEVMAHLSSSWTKAERPAPDRASVPAVASMPAGPDPTAEVSAALRVAAATLDAADATLSRADRSARAATLDRRLATRNAIVYFWYAALSLIAIIAVDRGADPGIRTGLLVATAVIGSAMAALTAWLSIGALATAGSDGRRRRDTWLGMVICALPMIIGMMMTGR